jgi:hypothetical protein
MHLALPAGIIHAALPQALAKLEATFVTARGELTEKVFQHLLEGAKAHDSSIESKTDQIEKMREMAARDVEHHLENHPAQADVTSIKQMIKMVEFVKNNGDADDMLLLDETEFEVISEFLPQTGEQTKPAAA